MLFNKYIFYFLYTATKISSSLVQFTSHSPRFHYYSLFLYSLILFVFIYSNFQFLKMVYRAFLSENRNFWHAGRISDGGLSIALGLGGAGDRTAPPVRTQSPSCKRGPEDFSWRASRLVNELNPGYTDELSYRRIESTMPPYHGCLNDQKEGEYYTILSPLIFDLSRPRETTVYNSDI